MPMCATVASRGVGTRTGSLGVTALILPGAPTCGQPARALVRSAHNNAHLRSHTDKPVWPALEPSLVTAKENGQVNTGLANWPCAIAGEVSSQRSLPANLVRSESAHSASPQNKPESVIAWFTEEVSRD